MKALQPGSLVERVAELRDQFDDAFTRPLESAEVPTQKLLAIVAGGSRFALRLDEIHGIFPLPAVTLLPDSPPGLLGIAGLRGRLISVHQLARLVGSGPDSGAGPLRWLVLPRSDDPLGLAIEGIDAYLSVPTAAIFPIQGGAAADPCIAILTHGDVTRRLLSVPALVAAIRRTAGLAAAPENQVSPRSLR